MPLLNPRHVRAYGMSVVDSQYSHTTSEHDLNQAVGSPVITTDHKSAGRLTRPHHKHTRSPSYGCRIPCSCGLQPRRPILLVHMYPPGFTARHVRVEPQPFDLVLSSTSCHLTPNPAPSPVAGSPEVTTGASLGHQWVTIWCVSHGTPVAAAGGCARG